MAIHITLRLDSSAVTSVRKGDDGAVEIVVVDEGDAVVRAVIELTPQQLAAICEDAAVL